MTSSKTTVASLVLLTLLLGHTPTTGQQKQAAGEDAIRKAGAAYIQAMQKRDLAAATATWTEQGTYTDETGSRSNARQLIKLMLTQPADAETVDFSNDEFKSTIRFLTSNVAIAEGTHTSADVTGDYTATWVKSGDRWLLDQLIDHPRGADRGTAELQELGWMVGSWLGQSDKFTVRCDANWSENGKFIVQRFVVERDGQTVVSGEQRIGWHPGIKAIRSWGFDSRGGIIEGRWRQQGDDAWVVRNSGVAADGSSSSSISFWLREGDDRCALKTSNVNIAADEVEDAIVEFRRVGVSE